MRTLGSLLVCPARAGAGWGCARTSQSSTSIVRSSPSSTSSRKVVLLHPRCCSRSFRGASSSTSCGRSAARHVNRAVSRRLPPQQQVFGSPGGLPLARRQPAGRPLPSRLRRTDRATAADSPTQRTDPIRGTPAGRPTLKSLTAVDRALMRASVVEVNKLEHRVSFLATTASITPFIGLFGTVVGHHHCVRATSARPGRRTSASSRPASPKR